VTVRAVYRVTLNGDSLDRRLDERFALKGEEWRDGRTPPTACHQQAGDGRLLRCAGKREELGPGCSTTLLVVTALVTISRSRRRK
jgi:hypothetical protein